MTPRFLEPAARARRTSAAGLTGLTMAFGLLAGCAINGRVVQDHVVGPHGEDLTELKCSPIPVCYTLARQTCGGDFDVVQTAHWGIDDDMVVRCSRSAPSTPAADQAPAPAPAPAATPAPASTASSAHAAPASSSKKP